MRNKSKDIVKYDNKLNQIDFSEFSSLELNIFYCALCKLKDKSIMAVTISYEEICMIANLKKQTPQYIFDKLKKVKKKIFHLSLDPLGISRPGEIDYEQHLFLDWKNDKTNETLTFSIHPDFSWLINQNKLGFTSFELLEFVKMKSIHAKNLFRLLKQWKKKGVWKVNLADLKKGVCISPNTKDGDISSHILKPAINEILQKTESFRNLRFEGIHDGSCHKLTGFMFFWTPETRGQPDNYKEPTEDSIMFRLKDQIITYDDFNILESEFGETIVKKTITRILKKPYIGCLNIDTIRQWCTEDKAKTKTNRFHNFDQRDYDFEELEKKLFKV